MRGILDTHLEARIDLPVSLCVIAGAGVGSILICVDQSRHGIDRFVTAPTRSGQEKVLRLWRNQVYSRFLSGAKNYVKKLLQICTVNVRISIGKVA